MHHRKRIPAEASLTFLRQVEKGTVWTIYPKEDSSDISIKITNSRGLFLQHETLGYVKRGTRYNPVVKLTEKGKKYIATHHEHRLPIARYHTAALENLISGKDF